MIKILVTGGAGNVGGALARKLVENPNYYVVIADNLSTGSITKLPSKEFKNWTFVNCDVNYYTGISEIMLVNQFDSGISVTPTGTGASGNYWNSVITNSSGETIYYRCSFQ